VHRAFLAQLARATGTRVLAVDYRLAPEHPYPAALEDAVAAYRWALDAGYAPSQVVVAGDSAGGGLALATVVALRDAGAPLPAGAVCLSPWLDLALTGASMRSNARVDPILSYEILDGYARLYASAHDRTSPLISPLYADLRGLPPLLIQVGTEEVLLDDAVRCADRAQAAGVAVTLEVVDGMFHVFQMVGALPETQAAMREIAVFVKALRPLSVRP
jgi:acetyl esterase/lipase